MQKIGFADQCEVFAQRNDRYEKRSETHGLIPRYPKLTPQAQPRFVDMMRLIPRSLVIVYASKKYNHQDTLPWQGSMGMLVSSFNSVAVDPTPFVSFNIQLPSRTFDKIRRTSFFTAVAVSNAKVADAFTGHQEDRQAILDNLVNRESPESASQSLVWWMRCELVHNKTMTVGDHVIAVGQVIRSGPFKGWQGQEALVYSRGTSRLKLNGVPITPEDDARRMARLFWNQTIQNQRTANTPVQNLEVKDSESEEDNRQLQKSLMIQYYKKASVRKVYTGSSSFEWEPVLSQELPNCNDQENSSNFDVDSLNEITWSPSFHWGTVLSQELPDYNDTETLLSSDVESMDEALLTDFLIPESCTERNETLRKRKRYRRRQTRRFRKKLVRWRQERENVVKKRALEERKTEEDLATKYQYLDAFEAWQSSFVDNLKPYE